MPLHKADAHHKAGDVIELSGRANEYIHLVHDAAQCCVCTLKRRGLNATKQSGFAVFLIRIIDGFNDAVCKNEKGVPCLKLDTP